MCVHGNRLCKSGAQKRTVTMIMGINISQLFIIYPLAMIMRKTFINYKACACQY